MDLKFVSGWKQETKKVMVDKVISVKENTDRKRKKEDLPYRIGQIALTNKEERKKKNTDRTQTRLNTPHVRYNVKILPQ